MWYSFRRIDESIFCLKFWIECKTNMFLSTFELSWAIFTFQFDSNFVWTRKSLLWIQKTCLNRSQNMFLWDLCLLNQTHNIIVPCTSNYDTKSWLRQGHRIILLYLQIQTAHHTQCLSSASPHDSTTFFYVLVFLVWKHHLEFRLTFPYTTSLIIFHPTILFRIFFQNIPHLLNIYQNVIE